MNDGPNPYDFSEIQRREQLKDTVEGVWLVYQRLAHHAEEGSAQQEEFLRLRRYYVDVGREIHNYSREEQDRVLEEYPQLITQLRQEYGR